MAVRDARPVCADRPAQVRKKGIQFLEEKMKFHFLAKELNVRFLEIVGEKNLNFNFLPKI